MYNIKKKISYYLSIFVPFIMILGIIISSLMIFTDINRYGFIITLSKKIFSGIIIFCLIIYRISYKWRLKAREQYESSMSNSKKMRYYKLSAKERLKIDKNILYNDEKLLSTKYINSITKKGSSTPEKDLNKMVGLYGIKTEIEKLAAKLEYEKQTKSFSESNHMCFFGPPGTGKTTCAKIITGFLFKLKYIKKNNYIEINGSELRGNSLYETTAKVSKIIKSAYGGVLFIDEAYAMMNNIGNNQEIIATIVKEMEDNKDKFILILAGYTNEMRKLINSNPGLQSRIKYFFNFPNYTTEELKQIFFNMSIEKGFFVSLQTLDAFEYKIVEAKKDNNFGNARTVRNILEDAIGEHAYNLKVGNIEKNVKNKDRKSVV